MSKALDYDVVTGVSVEREMTADELANIKNLAAEFNAMKATTATTATARLSAQTKLAALGLTADEIAAL